MVPTYSNAVSAEFYTLHSRQREFNHARLQMVNTATPVLAFHLPINLYYSRQLWRPFVAVN
jgi:hypothetical protein